VSGRPGALSARAVLQPLGGAAMTTRNIGIAAVVVIVVIVLIILLA
jgi:hypothetical protein